MVVVQTLFDFNLNMNYIELCILASYLVLGCWGAETDQSISYKYHVSTDLQNWIQAFINCKSAGMELVSISTPTDQESIEKFLLQNGYNDGYWTSGTNLGNTTNYYWASTGNPIIYTKWLPNQPDNAKLAENKHRGENCIQWGIYRHSPKPIGWNDLACSYKLRYICQEPENCI